MQVQAIYHQGRIEFERPIRLKHDLVRLLVTIPDEEVDPQATYNLPPELVERARATRERLDALRNAPLPPDDELPGLTEKQLERMAAFELREAR